MKENAIAKLMPAQKPWVTDDFNYALPPELIAVAPTSQREESRLMVVNRQTGEIAHHLFRDLPQLLQPNDLLVLNNSKVRPSAMTTVDGAVEILLLEETSPQHWVVLVKPGRKAKPGQRLFFRANLPDSSDASSSQEKVLEAEVLKTLESGERVLRFFQPFDPHLSAEMPLPPYILKRREQLRSEMGTVIAFCNDAERYQTVYARDEGSVAAPTAGLHFTPEILAQLEHTFVTLHVGMGTFRPVKSHRLEDHEMHEERFSIPKELSEKEERLKLRTGKPPRIVAVGTTSTRVLESVAHLGAQRGTTSIFIYPPYTFKRVGAMITNFHLPKSTLLMLVSAFAGYELTMKAYQKAIEQKYRFYSYGDAMLIL